MYSHTRVLTSGIKLQACASIFNANNLAKFLNLSKFTQPCVHFYCGLKQLCIAVKKFYCQCSEV